MKSGKLLILGIVCVIVGMGVLPYLACVCAALRQAWCDYVFYVCACVFLAGFVCVFEDVSAESRAKK